MSRFLILVGVVLCTIAAVRAARDPVTVCVAFSVAAGIITYVLIERLAPMFMKAGLKGRDLGKSHRPEPECMGLVAAAVYLTTMVVFLPFPFLDWFAGDARFQLAPQSPSEQHQPGSILTFPHNKLAEMLSALISLLSMVLLGFADDVLDIPWRYKLFQPLLASIPLLVVYYVSSGSTWVMVPRLLHGIIGASVIDLGILYYAYMCLVTIFCTHSINILAGVNGVEAAQSLVIAVVIAANDLLFVKSPTFPNVVNAHLFSIYFLLPFIGVTAALLMHNWFPARVFVGDTFCYFAGMTIAVVGILGHFSRTVLFLFMPQLFNFALSLPQLFKQMDCPRHRLPKLNRGGLLEPSSTELVRLRPLGRLALSLFSTLGFARVKYDPATGHPVESTNLTLLNYILVRFGPMREDRLTMAVIGVQIFSSCIGLGTRYAIDALVL